MPHYVQVEIKESEKHGRGVYACEDIPKGSLLWSLTPIKGREGDIKDPIGWDAQPNVIYTKQEMEALADEMEDGEYKTMLWGGYAVIPHVRADVDPAKAPMPPCDDPSSSRLMDLLHFCTHHCNFLQRHYNITSVT